MYSVDGQDNSIDSEAAQKEDSFDIISEKVAGPKCP